MADRAALVIFPHAGGSASAYRDLTSRLQADFDVHVVELPGHGRLGQRPFLPDMRAIADFAHEQVSAIAARQPTAFFGHSMGAWVALGAAQLAQRLEGRGPVHLFASAARPPHLGIHRNLLALDPDAFVRDLERLGGVPPELAADRAALELFLPALRADLAVIEAFKPPAGTPLDAPVTALRAAGDEITFEDAGAWRDTTRGAFDLQTLSGGHFYLMEQPDLVCAVIRRALREAPATA